MTRDPALKCIELDEFLPAVYLSIKSVAYGFLGHVFGHIVAQIGIVCSLNSKLHLQPILGEFYPNDCHLYYEKNVIRFGKNFHVG